ncbi:MAG: hypothetical protein ACO1NQ_07870 [Flavobacteriales bacterium]
MKNAEVVLAGFAVLLLGTLLLVVATAHAVYVDACVCVVNSAGRAAVALALTAALGVMIPFTSSAPSRVHSTLAVVQTVTFITALFFLVQHVFFVLQLA